MKKIVLALLFSFNCYASEQQSLSPMSQSSNQPISVRERSGSESHAVYIPQHYDVTDALHREAACCFCTSRWILQPINVVAPLISSGLIAVGEYMIESNPTAARWFNGIGLGFSIAQFITSVLLVKVNNKLEGIDDYIDNRRRQEGNDA